VTNGERGEARKGSFTALKERDFALLWSGQSVSAVGDGIFTVALALEALHLTHRPSGFALVIAARMVPTIVLILVSGVVVDRVSRQLAMLVSDVARAFAVGCIAVLVGTGRVRLWELVVMSIVFGVADSFFGPASRHARTPPERPDRPGQRAQLDESAVGEWLHWPGHRWGDRRRRRHGVGLWHRRGQFRGQRVLTGVDAPLAAN
jgi:hypothetical protein